MTRREKEQGPAAAQPASQRGAFGRHQLCLLASMGSPFSLLVVGDRLAASLVARGLLEPRNRKGLADGFLGVTPKGLRDLADALEAGQLEQFFAPEFTRDRPRIYITGRARKK